MHASVRHGVRTAGFEHVRCSVRVHWKKRSEAGLLRCDAGGVKAAVWQAAVWLRPSRQWPNRPANDGTGVLAA